MNEIMGTLAAAAFVVMVFGMIVHIISRCGKISNERADKILLLCLFAALTLLCIGLCIITISMALKR